MHAHTALPCRDSADVQVIFPVLQNDHQIHHLVDRMRQAGENPLVFGVDYDHLLDGCDLANFPSLPVTKCACVRPSCPGSAASRQCGGPARETCCCAQSPGRFWDLHPSRCCRDSVVGVVAVDALFGPNGSIAPLSQPDAYHLSLLMHERDHVVCLSPRPRLRAAL